MSTENLFVTAARNAYRFPSAVGDLTAEQLWGLPLKKSPHTRGVRADLNGVAIEVNEQLKAVTTESFVDDSPGDAGRELENKLEIVKHVIATKKKERDAAEKAAETRARKQRIAEVLADKRDEKLKEMSEEELEAALADG